MVIGSGIWYKEIQISGFSEMMMIYGNKLVFNFEKHKEGILDSSMF